MYRPAAADAGPWCLLECLVIKHWGWHCVSMRNIGWREGAWTHEPAASDGDGDDLLVTAVEGSDAWRNTSYGFVHASEHALLVPMATESAMEVDFVAEFSQQFDQAGLFLRADPDHWVKAGVEFADGSPQVGAVVTWPNSDWSVSSAPTWLGRAVTVRASRSGDAVTIRAGIDGDLALVRVVPVPPEAELTAGPLICAPTRAELTIRFTGWRVGPPDDSLHPEG